MTKPRTNFKPFPRLRTAALAALALALAAPAAAAPAASGWEGLDEARVRLLSGSDGAGGAAGGDGRVPLGLHFRMDEGWKISWRSPGDAGLPPQLDWSGSANLAGAEVAWPVPTRFTVLGFEVLGYHDEVVLPITARAVDPEKPVRLDLHLNYLACSEICVPAEADLALTLAAGPGGPTAHAHLIDRYRARVPATDAGAGLEVARAAAREAGERLTLEVAARSKVPFADPDLFVEGPADFRFGTPEVSLAEDGRRAVLRVPVDRVAGAPGPLSGRAVTLTLVDEGRALEREVTVTAGAAAPGPGAAQVSVLELAGVLGLALLGGLILNLMPCVLPVLSIKLLGVVGHGGRERAHVRLSFLASSAGILASFLVLAGALVGLKYAGVAVGWGIQFQQPAFLIAMVLILMVFASNLWGLFEIRLPGRLADGAAQSGHGHSLGGHFLTGALATLLATPCTAPFLGTAVGFALARGPVEIALVFAALGLGLATPYLVVAAAPGLATRLPRPGPWMIRLRRVLGFALAGTAVWLVTVLAAQVSDLVAVIVGVVAALVVAALWLARRAPRPGPVGVAAVGVLALIAFAAPARFAPPPAPAAAGTVALPDELWRDFDPAAISAQVAQGRVVLVDVTADWCLTCKVNEALVLRDRRVADRLLAPGVVAMRADWTRPDERIAAYLASFGRYGIPFNAVYGPGLPKGEALPELLTVEAVLRALGRAGGPGAEPAAAPAASGEETPPRG